MKKTIATLSTILLLASFTSFAGPSGSGNSCEILREGTFEYGNAPDNIRVVINEETHTEYHNNGKYIIESKLNWINECEYNMTMVRVTIPNFPYNVGDVMNVKIDRVVGNEIFYVATVKGKSWDGKLTKI